MASQEKARGGPELPAGSFQVGQEHELQSEGAIPNPQSLAQGACLESKERVGKHRRGAMTVPASLGGAPTGSTRFNTLPTPPSALLLPYRRSGGQRGRHQHGCGARIWRQAGAAERRRSRRGQGEAHGSRRPRAAASPAAEAGLSGRHMHSSCPGDC